MKLIFTYRLEYGRQRLYPTNEPAKAICAINGRKCLELTDLTILKMVGFQIRVQNVSGTVETSYEDIATIIRRQKGSSV